jgi:hypothetical protein
MDPFSWLLRKATGKGDDRAQVTWALREVLLGGRRKHHHHFARGKRTVPRLKRKHRRQIAHESRRRNRIG